MFDQNLSARIGADDLLTFHRAFVDFEERYLPNKFTDESTFGETKVGQLYRLTRYVLLDFQIDYLTYILQHEVFGHGARAREFGQTNVRYELHMGPPYNNNRSITYADSFPLGQEVVLDISGSQGSRIMSDEILQQALVGGAIDYRRSGLYALTALDLPGYIWSTNYDSPNPPSDILHYLARVPGLPTNALQKLKTAATLCLADPMLWYSLYGLGHYISSGETEMRIPTIRIAGIHWLPQFRIELTPFGWEYIMENRLVDSLHLWTVSAGLDRDNQSFRLGATVGRLIETRHFELGAELHGWWQPDRIGTTQFGNGMMALVAPEYRLIGETGSVGMLAEIGYKTNGFLEGEPIAAGWILRAGLAFH